MTFYEGHEGGRGIMAGDGRFGTLWELWAMAGYWARDLLQITSVFDRLVRFPVEIELNKICYAASSALGIIWFRYLPASLRLPQLSHSLILVVSATEPL